MTETCACGAPAITEVQCGWDSRRNRGVYSPLCQRCYEDTEEAARYRAEFADLVQAVHNGAYYRTALGWEGPLCGRHDDTTHRRLSQDPYGIGSEV